MTSAHLTRTLAVRVIGCLLIAPLPVAAQAGATSTSASSSVRSVRAAKVTSPIRLDGRLDEPSWGEAGVAAEFTQAWPNPGATVTERTEARVLYDEQAIYVAVRMYDTRPDSVAAQLARRDATGIYSDWIHVIIDSYHDRRTAFRFSVNPRGVKKDVYTFDDGNEDLSWDAVWDVATLVDSLGWTAEFRIPLSQLRFGSAGTDAERVWGFQVQRDIARKDERDTWAPWSRQTGGFVSRFGDVTGLVGVPAPSRLELQPYVSSRVTRAPRQDGNPFFRKHAGAGSAGLDLKFGLPRGLTLTATINPDFGQVEVDPAVVNLTAFETFFPERRPFFLEGVDVFRFGQVRSFNNYNSQQFYYSRRIGRTPQRSLFGPGILFVDAPDQTTILGAAKMSGKTGSWSVGLMNVVTAEERGRAADTAGTRLTSPVEPLTNYFVGRVRRDFRAGQSVLGGMLTATDRRLNGSLFDPLLRSRARLGGMDFENTWSGRAWAIGGYLTASEVTGSEEAILLTQRSSARYYQRPDARYLGLHPTRTSLSGEMAEVGLSHGGDWDISVDFKEASPGFEINDLGFQGRTDYHALSSLVARNFNRANQRFRNAAVYGYSNYAWNFGGNNLFNAYGAGANATFANFWRAGAGATYSFRALSDRMTRGGPLAGVPTRWSLSVNGGSDARKKLAASGQIYYSHDALAGSTLSTGVSFDARPSTSLRVSIGPGIESRREQQQYVRAVVDPLAAATYGSRYVFADLRQTTVAVDARLDWTFSPVLSLQLYGQPFVSAGNYRSFKELIAPRSTEYGIYGRDRGSITREGEEGASRYVIDPDASGPAPAFTVGNPDFNSRSLRGNAVLRWEYRPGSALFVVWQQLRSETSPLGTFALRNLGEIFSAPVTNVFLIKATYWLAR